MPILFSRSVGPVAVTVVEQEKHDSTIEITEIPIESGAKVTDHAFRNPNKVMLEVASHGAVPTFAALKTLQESREPFTLVTGLFVYRNMLIKSLSPVRDSAFSSIFRGKIELQEAIIVGTSYVAGQGAEGAGQPGGANSTRAAPPAKARAGDPATARRVTSTVARGGNRAVAAPVTGETPEARSNATMLRRLFD